MVYAGPNHVSMLLKVAKLLLLLLLSEFNVGIMTHAKTAARRQQAEDSGEKTAGTRKLTTVDRLWQLSMLNGRQWIQLH